MKTIDVLILEELLDGEAKTAAQIAKTWGEDFTRVYEWLIKFGRIGLLEVSDARKGVLYFRGKPDAIRLFLKNRVKV